MSAFRPLRWRLKSCVMSLTPPSRASPRTSSAHSHKIVHGAAKPPRTPAASPARPNPSFNPRRATASGVSPVHASRTIVAYRAYTARLRARG